MHDFDASTCYWPPLTLEKGGEHLFLETEFMKTADGMETQLKNVNQEHTQVWRYHHYDSAVSYQVKCSTLLASLKKVHNAASNQERLRISGVAKLKEFVRLQYPMNTLKYMCRVVARDYNSPIWFSIFKELRA